MSIPSLDDLRRLAQETLDAQKTAALACHGFRKALVDAMIDLPPTVLGDPVLAELFGELHKPADDVKLLADMYRKLLGTVIFRMPPGDAAATLEALQKGEARSKDSCPCPECTASREGARVEGSAPTTEPPL